MIVYPNKSASRYLGMYLMAPCAISLSDVTVEQASVPMKDLGLSDEAMQVLESYDIEYVGQFNQDVIKLPDIKLKNIVEVSNAIKRLSAETNQKELALV